MQITFTPEQIENLKKEVAERPVQKRLSWRSRFPSPVVWGFPISHSHKMKGYHALLSKAQLEKELTFPERMRLFYHFTTKYQCEIIKECKKIFDSGDVHYTSVVNNGPPRYVVAFFVCTKPDDSILPPQDKIDELIKVAIQLGFDWEPHWYMKNT